MSDWEQEPCQPLQEEQVKEKEFIDFLKAEKKPAATIRSYVKTAKIFETYLLENKQINDLEDATPRDLADYVAWGRQGTDNMYRALWGVKAYYQSRQNEEMWFSTIEEMEFLQNEVRKLGEFPGVDRTAVQKLKSIGISTVNQLLHAVKSEADQIALAEKCGAARESVAELVRMSNLARLPGLKKVRGRLYYKAGLDTFAKIAGLESEETCQLLKAYVEKSGFNGVPTVRSEAEFTIRMARFFIQKETVSP
jgi:hypothetical protein